MMHLPRAHEKPTSDGDALNTTAISTPKGVVR